MSEHIKQIFSYFFGLKLLCLLILFLVAFSV